MFHPPLGAMGVKRDNLRASSKKTMGGPLGGISETWEVHIM